MSKISRSDFKLSTADKIDARTALILLSGTSLSLTDAARQALINPATAAPRFKPVAFQDAMREWIADLHRRQRRMGTLEFYDQRLEAFSSSPLADHWQTVTRQELKPWLEQSSGGAVTKGMTFRAIRAFYRWAQHHEPAWCGVPPTEGWKITGTEGDRNAPRFYPVATVAALLERAGPALRPALALQLFAGLRPEEVAPGDAGKGRISWEDINPAERMVRVPADVAKTRVVRVLEGLPEALWAWLPANPESGKKDGPIWLGTYDWYQTQARAALAEPWIRDGLRHTFATYAVALIGDVGRVSEWLGHEGSTALIHRHYKAAARKADAVAFFGLRPSKKARV